MDADGSDMAGEPAQADDGEVEISLRLRLPKRLLDALEARAERRGITCERLIRETLERAVPANTRSD